MPEIQRPLAPSANSRPVSNTAADRPDFTASTFCPSTNIRKSDYQYILWFKNIVFMKNIDGSVF
ncbi:hypothetical protein WDQ52_004512 [Salmonella enterica]